MNTEKNTKIFISYSFKDKVVADKIIGDLKGANFNVITESDILKEGENFLYSIKYYYEVSDFILILLSNNLINSNFFQNEFTDAFINETKKRKITVLPVIIEKCNLPSDFLSFEIIDLSRNYDEGIKKIIKKLNLIPNISLFELSPPKFENLIYDLLKAYGFKNIKRQSINDDLGVDFVAEYINKNPFGFKNKETWIFETKYYSQSRVDIKSVQQLQKVIENFNYPVTAALITNSNLTSVVEEYIQVLKNKFNTEIVVIDGDKLKKLISNRKGIVKKYFDINLINE